MSKKQELHIYEGDQAELPAASIRKMGLVGDFKVVEVEVSCKGQTLKEAIHGVKELLGTKLVRGDA